MVNIQKNNNNKKPYPEGLSEQSIAIYHHLLDQEITDYDCGKLCAHLNKGVPLCCSEQYTLPLLYKSELAMLQKKGDMWKQWQPKKRKEKKLVGKLDKQEAYCQCTGIEFCLREQRSIACRTFPLEPYLDENGNLAGLVFVADFRLNPEKTSNLRCPLTQRPDDIRDQYIQSALLFWRELLRIPAEYHTYLESSRSLRKKHSKSGIAIKILKLNQNKFQNS